MKPTRDQLVLKALKTMGAMPYDHTQAHNSYPLDFLNVVYITECANF